MKEQLLEETHKKAFKQFINFILKVIIFYMVIGIIFS